jgi:maleate isomerase/arylmalonate decarboxylase
MRIGVLVPFTNTNLEPDLARLLPKHIQPHFTRIGGYDVEEVPDSDQMMNMGETDISEALRLITGVRPDAVLYGCTSATLAHGREFDNKLKDAIAAATGAKAITAAGALVSELQAIEATRIAFASPYVGEVNNQAIRFFEQAGIETVHCAEIGSSLNSHEQGELTPDEIFALAVKADHPHAQAIVMSCTDLRAVEVIDRIETALNKPVITSNQAMVAALLR